MRKRRGRKIRNEEDGENIEGKRRGEVDENGEEKKKWKGNQGNEKL